MNALHPLTQYTSSSHRRARRFIRRYIARPVLSSLVSPSVEGQENVAGLDGAYIVVGNHSSHLDAPMMFTLLPGEITDNLATGAAADYFYRRRFVSRLTALFFNTYPIERKGKIKKLGGRGLTTHDGPSPAAGMTGRLLKAGIPILIFPEGTRSRDGRMGEFKAGAAALSQKLGVPIVPVALIGGYDAMPVGTFWPKKGRPRVKLVIGRPMHAEPGENVEHYNARIRASVAAMRATGHPHSGEGAEAA
ncbi:lysophospholipid acyltransferase family protein [Flaviflexus huanghaiensis]|uniref:lysophospholipid acyltransferase family protein n=1 Tax=Flaviflexus huanghaiensis TaxID=1111473 RepID=UPI0015FAD23B|nr:lysophospholipid acyltransferase family protein [Flaviflexus huanghaiensis]